MNEEFPKKHKAYLKISLIVFDTNLFIQFLMFIFILIIIGRIKLRSDYGFPHFLRNQLTQNRIIDNIGIFTNKTYTTKKYNKRNSIKPKKVHTNIDSEKFRIKNKKRYKKRKSLK